MILPIWNGNLIGGINWSVSQQAFMPKFIQQGISLLCEHLTVKTVPGNWKTNTDKQTLPKLRTVRQFTVRQSMPKLRTVWQCTVRQSIASHFDGLRNWPWHCRSQETKIVQYCCTIYSGYTVVTNTYISLETTHISLETTHTLETTHWEQQIHLWNQHIYLWEQHTHVWTQCNNCIVSVFVSMWIHQ